MRQLSVEVTDRSRSVNSVLYTLRRKGPGLAAKIQALAEPLYETPPSELTEGVPPGTLPSGPALSDTLPDFLSQLGFLERAVENAIQELARRDLAVFDTERLLAALRSQRDGQLKVVYGKVVKLRFTLQGEFEAPNLELLGLQGPTTQDPTLLLRVAGNLARVLAMPDLEFYLGQPSSSSPFDAAARAAELQAEVDTLKSLVDAIHNGVQDYDQTQVARKDAMAEYDNVFLHVARILEDYFLLVGDKEMARRVRPSRVRPGRTVVDPGDLPNDDGDVSNDDTSGDVPSDDASGDVSGDGVSGDEVTNNDVSVDDEGADGSSPDG